MTGTVGGAAVGGKVELELAGIYAFGDGGGVAYGCQDSREDECLDERELADGCDGDGDFEVVLQLSNAS